MGYILPITNHQYTNYHMLHVRQKKNKYYIEGPFKIVLDEAYENKKSKQFKSGFHLKKEQLNKSNMLKSNSGGVIDLNI